MEKETLIKSLKHIDDLIWKSRTDKSIDVSDLKKERVNCVKAIKKLKI